MYNYHKMMDAETAIKRVGELAAADETHVYVHSTTRAITPIPGMKAIVNRSTGDVVCVVSSRYTILQHSMAFTAMIRAIESLGLGNISRFAIEISGDRNLVRMAAIFKSVTIATPNNEPVWLGVRITNSYNKTNSFNGDVLLWYPRRSTVTILGRTSVPRFAKHHTGISGENAEEYIREFVERVISNTSPIERLIEKATDDTLTFETVSQREAFLRPIMVGKKHIDAVIDLIPNVTSRWEVFSVVTAYTSLNRDLSPIMRDNINDYAERHLLEPKIVVVPSVSDAERDGMPKSCQSSRVVATDNI